MFRRYHWISILCNQHWKSNYTRRGAKKKMNVSRRGYHRLYMEIDWDRNAVRSCGLCFWSKTDRVIICFEMFKLQYNACIVQFYFLVYNLNYYVQLFAMHKKLIWNPLLPELKLWQLYYPTVTNWTYDQISFSHQACKNSFFWVIYF